MKICSACGASIDDTSKFCPQCGAKLDSDNSDTIITEDGQTIEANKVTDSVDKAKDSNKHETLLCRQCQALLHPTDEDWERGSVKCDHCGAETQIVERIKHNVEGTVKVDNSEQAEGYLNLANRAWTSRNYEDGLTYYKKLLEVDPNNIVAIYRLGICSVQSEQNVSEFKVYFEDACKFLNNKLKQFNTIPNDDLTDEQREEKEKYMNISKQMSDETLDYLSYLNGISGLNNGVSFVICESPRQCESRLQAWEIIAKVYYIVSFYIIDLNAKEKVLHDGGLLINKAENLPLLYKQSGFNNNGKPIEKDVRYQRSSQFCCFMADLHKEMVEMYNDLPSRKAKEDHLNNDMNEIKEKGKKLTAKRDKTKKELDTAINDLWENNPEIKSQRNLHKLLPLGVLLIGIIFGVISYYTGIFLYGIIVFIVAVVVAIILWGSVYKSFEKSVFPNEIKELQKSLSEIEEKCAKNEKAQNNKQAEINKFNKEKELSNS